MGVSAHPYTPRASAHAERLRARAGAIPVATRVERSPASLLLPFLLAVVILLGTTAYGLLRPQSHVHPAAPGHRGSLVWGNGLFANRSELKAWLNQHDASYAKWAKKHPAALRLVPKAPKPKR